MTTPDVLSKSGSEHGHQVALFAYCAVARIHGWDVADAWAVEGPQAFKKSTHKADDPPKVPALEWFHAIHNQGHGDKIRGANAKAEGVRKGIADTFLPWPIWTEGSIGDSSRIAYCGLYIEMKKPSEKPKTDKAKGGVSDEQVNFGEYSKRVGYGWIVCYSWREAATALRSYIEWESK